MINITHTHTSKKVYEFPGDIFLNDSYSIRKLTRMGRNLVTKERENLNSQKEAITKSIKYRIYSLSGMY